MKKGTGWPSGQYGRHCQLLSKHHQASFFVRERDTILICTERSFSGWKLQKLSYMSQSPGSGNNYYKKPSMGVQEIMRLCI